ncbi:unnamed protein product [Agarophyton chilense]
MQDLRKGRFEKAINLDEAHRQRKDNLVRIRNAKSKESFMKKHGECMSMCSTFATSAEVESMSTNDFNVLLALKYTYRLPQMVAGVFSEDPAEVIQAILGFRRGLSIDKNPSSLR